MPIIQLREIGNYCENIDGNKDVYKSNTTRIFPRDDYTAFIRSTNKYNKNYAKVLSVFNRYYFLKVPILGQHNLQARAECIRIGEDDYYYVWCGRTSASSIYNYFQLIRGGEPGERYITHWKGPNNRMLDLRFPDGMLAFQKTEDDSNGWPHEGCNPAKLLEPFLFFRT